MAGVVLGRHVCPCAVVAAPTRVILRSERTRQRRDIQAILGRLAAARRASGSCRTPRTGPRTSALCKISAWSNIDARTRALFDYHHHYTPDFDPPSADDAPRTTSPPSSLSPLPARIPRERAPGSFAIMGRLPAASSEQRAPLCRPPICTHDG